MAYSILIVDDQREILRVLESALATLRQPLVITGVLSGEEALMEARLGPIDLLVADLRLPGMTGLELYRQIQTERPEIKTILITGIPDPKLQTEAEQAGADAFFTKPVPIDEFLEAVQRLLNIDPSSTNEPLPSVVEAPPEGDTGLTDRLTRLHADLQAEFVSIVDDHGRVLITTAAGSNPSFETSLVPALLSAATAGERIAHFLGADETGIQFFYADRSALVLSPVGNTYVLVALVHGDGPQTDTAAVHALMRDAVTDLAGILKHMGIPVTLAEPVAVPPFVMDVETMHEPEPTEMDGGLEALLDGAAPEELSQEADRFWEPDEEQSGAGTLSADGLSYEQAVQLGLAPDEKDVD